MDFIARLKNYRLKFREKFSNRLSCQLARSIRTLCVHPLKSIRGGVLKAMVNLTYECHCKCDYCWCGSYDRHPEKELSSFEVKKILDEIAEYPSMCTAVSFIGGEPLLRKDIYELIDYAVSRGLFTEMETNGVDLSRDVVLKLKKSGLNHIFVRIEGPDRESHDLVSKAEGCFENAIDGIKACVKEGLSCSIFMNAHRDKIKSGRLKKIIDIGRRLKVNSVRVIFATLAGRWVDREEERLTSEEENEVRKLADPGFVYLESSEAFCKNDERFCAALKKDFFYVSCYGEVQPCPFVPVSFGDMRTRPLNKILESMWAHPIFNSGYKGCLMNNPDFRARYILPAKLDISYKNINI